MYYTMYVGVNLNHIASKQLYTVNPSLGYASITLCSNVNVLSNYCIYYIYICVLDNVYTL